LGKNTLKAWSKTDGLSTLRMDEVVLRTLVTYLISFVLTALSRRVMLWAKSRIIQRERDVILCGQFSIEGCPVSSPFRVR